MRYLVLTTVLAVAFSGDGVAASFSVDCEGQLKRASQACFVKLAGKIATGDAMALRKVVQSPLAAGWLYGTLLLDSPGGDVKEALLLAGVVREALLATSTVDSDPDPIVKGSRNFWPCVSACALVWFAGVDRSSWGGRNKTDGRYGVGLHRPYFLPVTYNNSPSVVAEAQQIMTATVRDFLLREQVPEVFIQKMLQRSSREVYWLDEGGDNAPLDGRAPWFEEMMIARCAYDPSYDRLSDEAAARRLLATRSPDTSPEWSAYVEWRTKYRACEYQTRRAAQAQMRK